MKNVDSKLLLSIGAAESGYYKVKYMLRQNNIYGGMSSKGLIKYNNIELGVLTYVRMMSKNYYARGLTNMYSIGKVYCPTYENGTKIAPFSFYNSLLPSIARARVTSSAYSKSAPTGSPKAIREIFIPNGLINFVKYKLVASPSTEGDNAKITS